MTRLAKAARLDASIDGFAAPCCVSPGALLATLLPDSRRVDIPEASHIMNVQNPAALNGELLTFLSLHR